MRKRIQSHRQIPGELKGRHVQKVPRRLANIQSQGKEWRFQSIPGIPKMIPRSEACPHDIARNGGQKAQPAERRKSKKCVFQSEANSMGPFGGSMPWPCREVARPQHTNQQQVLGSSCNLQLLRNGRPKRFWGLASNQGINFNHNVIIVDLKTYESDRPNIADWRSEPLSFRCGLCWLFAICMLGQTCLACVRNICL